MEGKIDKLKNVYLLSLFVFSSPLHSFFRLLSSVLPQFFKYALFFLSKFPLETDAHQISEPKEKVRRYTYLHSLISTSVAVSREFVSYTTPKPSFHIPSLFPPTPQHFYPHTALSYCHFNILSFFPKFPFSLILPWCPFWSPLFSVYSTHLNGDYLFWHNLCEVVRANVLHTPSYKDNSWSLDNLTYVTNRTQPVTIRLKDPKPFCHTQFIYWSPFFLELKMKMTNGGY